MIIVPFLAQKQGFRARQKDTIIIGVNKNFVIKYYGLNN
jgi:hypothetical protein